MARFRNLATAMQGIEVLIASIGVFIEVQTYIKGLAGSGISIAAIGCSYFREMLKTMATS